MYNKTDFYNWAKNFYVSCKYRRNAAYNVRTGGMYMFYETYPFSLPPLPYSYDALEPYIDTETMRIHHNKHFQAYTDHLNNALEPYPHLHRLTLSQLLSGRYMLPQIAREAILNNGGGYYNHAFFFDELSPPNVGEHRPRGTLEMLINRTWGDFSRFQDVFNCMALSVFGSGWVALSLSRQERLRIITLHNQETVLPRGETPLLQFDVWEHAYYLKYQNRRNEYIDALWNVVTFPII